MPLAARESRQALTYADYCTWPEDERWELIDGEAWDMSPAPSRRHQDVALELGVQVKAALRGRPCSVYLAPFDVRLPRGEETDERIDTVVQPDLSVFCDRSRLDERGARGAPDWIVEVLSSSTAIKDQTVKRDLYGRHGVAEYWIVHPLDRVLTLYRRAGPDRGFGPAQILAAAGVVTAESVGVAIDWDLVFAESA
jgi:Uma2 family endonuclease